MLLDVIFSGPMALEKLTNWGGVSEFSGKYRKVEKPVARTKKVPRYIKLGRSGRHAPWRPFLRFAAEFREKIARGKKVARRRKSFQLKCCFEGRLVPSVDQPLKKYAPLPHTEERIIIQFLQGCILADESKIHLQENRYWHYPSATVANRQYHFAHSIFLPE